MNEKPVWKKLPCEVKTFTIRDSPTQHAYADVTVNENKKIEKIELDYGEKITLYPRPLKLLVMLLDTLKEEGYEIYD